MDIRKQNTQNVSVKHIFKRFFSSPFIFAKAFVFRNVVTKSVRMRPKSKASYSTFKHKSNREK
jgi:hypothetical protein